MVTQILEVSQVKVKQMMGNEEQTSAADIQTMQSKRHFNTIDPVRTRKQPQKKNTPYKSRSQVFKLNPGLFSNVIAKSNSQPIPSKRSFYRHREARSS